MFKLGLLLIFVVVAIIGVVFEILRNKVKSLEHKEWLSMFSAVFIVIGIAFLAVLLIFVPISRYEVKAHIAEHKALQETIEAYRTTEDTDFEKTTISLLVAESNKTLARQQYACKSFFLNIYNPREVLDVKPIK